jgi:outer membrane protein assembly factor BamB
VPVYGAVFVFISSYTQEGGLLAIHGETGQVLNVYRNTFFGAWQSFAFAEGNLLMANHVAGSMLDLRTGARRSFGSSSWHSGHNTPVLCDGKAYLIGAGFGAADYRSGKPLYYFPIEGTSFKSEETNLNRSENTLALWNDMAFFGNLTGHAYAYDAPTGKRLWRADLGSRVRSAPSISTASPESDQAVVYIGCDDGKLWALDALDGNKLWSLETGARITADAWIADGVVYVANHDGKLIALTE